MSSEDVESGFDDNPIITYSNRIQKLMFLLTVELGMNNTVDLTEKRKLRLLIANLPPEAKTKLKPVYDRCLSEDVLTTKEFDDMYGKVSDWIYDNILKEAFKAKPRFAKKDHI